MNRFKKLSYVMTVFLMLLTTVLFAQNGAKVSGRVVDAKGEAIIGATVIEQGTYNGTITDYEGKFEIKLSTDNSILQITFFGYKEAAISASSSALSNIVLEEDALKLDEVVVIGYGTVKKSDLSGSIVAIKPEEMNRGAVTSPQELLQGKVAGLAITSGDGGPGAGSTIRIRSGASLNASNDPLIVIDGVPVASDAAPGTSDPLSTINPNDIATMTVLKDASATAIYGSRASNGVIIITTKKGGTGAMKLSYNSTYTLKDPYNRVNVMNGTDFNSAVLGQYAEGTALGDAARELLNIFPNTSTNWQDAIYQLGLSTDQNIAASGKVGFLPYRVSLGYNNERGTIKTSKYERFTGAVNLSPKFLDDHLSVDVNFKGTINNNRFADSGAVGAAVYYDPTKPIYADDAYGYNGYYNHTSNALTAPTPNTLSAVNPLSMLYDVNNSGTTSRTLGNIQLDYKIHGFEDLRANLNVGYDRANSTGDNYVSSGSFQSALDSEFAYIGQGSSWENKRQNKVLDFYLNYNKELESIKSNIDFMAGYSWQHFYYENFGQSKSNVMDSVGDKEGWEYNSDESRYYRSGAYAVPYENYLVSFFGRLNYSYDNRFLLTATLRRDGSSRFSENNRWGLFPSAAVAWTLSNEKFMQGASDVVSHLKLRAGYGITGQQEIGDYLYMPNYTFGSNINSSYLGGLLLKPNGYSPDLKWEETTTYNVGVDYGFLRNRISGSFEYYQKYTSDLLNTVSAPAGTNFSNLVLANIGTMKNSGVEFSINARAIESKDFNWDIGYNVTWNDSDITKLTANYNPDYEGIAAANAPYGTGVVLSRHQVGYSPYNFWLFQQVYDEAGKPIQNAIVDRNEDGQITDADRYFTGKSALADYYMGFSSQFRYKKWDLGFNLRANLGNYAFNAGNADNGSLYNFGNQGFLTNYNITAIEYTGFNQLSSIDQKCSDLFLENASFLKMDNLTLGYSFDNIFKSKLSGRLSGSVQNVFTVTKYSGLDPEIPGVTGIDNSIWPRARTFTLGLSFNL
ncbi:MAG: TonB-dependent receptor [Rikenellaceae bacterium]